MPPLRAMSNVPSRPLLVALGSADGCDAALRFACQRAVLLGQPLLLVRVVEHGGGDMDELLVRRALLRAGELTRGTVRIETMTPRGPLVPTLVDLSRGADAVVLERRPFSPLQRMTMGSVSAAIAGRSHTTTVSVPAAWKASQQRDRHIVVGIDRASDDLAVVAHAFARAARLGAALKLVHAWQMDTPYDDAIVEQADVEEWRKGYVSALEKAVREQGDRSVPWSLQVVHATPKAALLTACNIAGALVLGRGGADVPLVSGLGAVPRALLVAAACPVEVTNPQNERPGRMPTTKSARVAVPEPT